MVISKCKICGSNNIKDIFQSVNVHGRHLISTKDKFTVSKCQKCQVVFLRNVSVNVAFYKKYYKPGYYNPVNIKPGSTLERFLNFLFRFSTRRKENLITDFVQKKHKKIDILDVGCGGGNFLLELSSSRFNKFGTEINQEGYETCKKRDLPVFYGDINKINFGRKKFDVISLWHVLEHVEKPHKIIKTIYKLLKPSGILILQTPNTSSLGFKIGKRDWFHLDSPRHLALYNKKSVETLCQLTGFKIIGIKNEFYDYPQDLFWSVRNSPLKYFIYPFYPIFRLLSQEHLTYILKKSK